MGLSTQGSTWTIVPPTPASIMSEGGPPRHPRLLFGGGAPPPPPGPRRTGPLGAGRQEVPQRVELVEGEGSIQARRVGKDPERGAADRLGLQAEHGARAVERRPVRGDA